MQHTILRAAFALIAPLFLFGCVLTPGKFVSSLIINKDRSFTFAYKGEVIAVDPMGGMGDLAKSLPDTPDPDATEEDKTAAAEAAADKAKASETEENKRKAMAESLAKEAGYKSVVYQGKGKFLIDYEMKGVLSHSFLFPFNTDAEVIIPFMTVEARNNGTVRVRAPGYAGDKDTKSSPMGGGGADTSKHLDGVFTLDTDADIVSQNNEEGAKAVGARKQIIWKATPLTKDAPNAVLRMTN